MNVVKLPDEFTLLADGSAFSLDWWAPSQEAIARLILERQYEAIQQLIIDSMLRIYQSLREIELMSGNKRFSKQWNLLRIIANRILNYAARTADPAKEKHLVVNLIANIKSPVESLIKNEIYTKVSLNEDMKCTLFGFSSEDIQLFENAEEEQRDQAALQQYRDRIANLDSFLNPPNEPVSQHIQKIFLLLRTLQKFRLEELSEVRAEPIPEFEFIKPPKLFSVFERELISIRGDPAPGEYLKCITLLPLQTITYRIEKTLRTERTSEITSSIVDSNSSEAQDSLMSEIQNTDKTMAASAREQNDYFREQNHLDAGLRVNVEYGKNNNLSLDKLVTNVGVNVDTSMNWSNDKERSQEISAALNTEASTEAIAKSVSNQVSKVNTSRQITLTEKTTEITSSEEKNLTEITMQNPSKINAIQIITHQAVEQFRSIIVLSNISFFATNGFLQLKLPYTKLSGLKTIIPSMYNNIEQEMKHLTIKTSDGIEIKPLEQGFKYPNSESIGIKHGLPIYEHEFELNTKGLIEIVKVLPADLLDKPSIDAMNITNSKMQSEVKINEGVANVIYKISEGSLEVTELGKILFAWKGKEPISTVQYLRLDNESERKVLL